VTLSLQAALGTADDPEERDARTSTGQTLKRRELAAQQALGRAGAAVSAKAQLAGLVTEIDLEVTHHAEEIEAAREAVQAAAKEARRAADERDAAVAEAQERLTAGQEAVAQASGRLRDATAAVTVERGHGDDLSTVTAATHTATSLRKSAETALRSADLELGKARARMDALEQRAAALPDLTGRVTGCERELGDWSLLTRALGKDGAQALEIDAAGPEVSRIANELLAVYPGEAFSIAFETLREKKSARGEYAEAFDVKCFHNGREKAVEVLSGGQAVVIGEAIGLAIAIHNARKSGVKWETLWRDETAGALDPEAAQAYVLMLRRARELGGFHQVIFIAHQPEVTEAADVRLLVDAGQVAVEGQRRAA
jgi:exonuclease SbcC